MKPQAIHDLHLNKIMLTNKDFKHLAKPQDRNQITEVHSSFRWVQIEYQKFEQ